MRYELSDYEWTAIAAGADARAASRLVQSINRITRTVFRYHRHMSRRFRDTLDRTVW
jgi:hypothetical protein